MHGNLRSGKRYPLAWPRKTRRLNNALSRTHIVGGGVGSSDGWHTEISESLRWPGRERMEVPRDCLTANAETMLTTLWTYILKKHIAIRSSRAKKQRNGILHSPELSFVSCRLPNVVVLFGVEGTSSLSGIAQIFDLSPNTALWRATSAARGWTQSPELWLSPESPLEDPA